jgi:signal peptidase I
MEPAVKPGSEERKIPEEKPKKRRSPMRQSQRFVLHALIILAAVWVMFGWLFGITTAPSGDMYPRIDMGDLVLFYRLAGSYKAQDTVVLTKNGTRYIGRVVAAAGDEVTVDEGLYINGSQMIEPNIFFPTPQYEGFVEYPLKLAEDEVFILTDRRDGGEDSRYYGPVRLSEIDGLIITIVRRTNL